MSEGGWGWLLLPTLLPRQKTTTEATRRKFGKIVQRYRRIAKLTASGLLLKFVAFAGNWQVAKADKFGRRAGAFPRQPIRSVDGPSHSSRRLHSEQYGWSHSRYLRRN